jgi:hypothetical protein
VRKTVSSEPRFFRWDGLPLALVPGQDEQVFDYSVDPPQEMPAIRRLSGACQIRFSEFVKLCARHRSARAHFAGTEES